MRWILLAWLVCDSVQAAIPPNAWRFRGDLTRYAQQRFGDLAPVAVFAAQIQAESGWVVVICNYIHACGLGQIMPRTAVYLARACGIGAVNTRNPQWSMRALVCYNHLNLRRHAGAECARWRETVADYNAGPGRHGLPRETRNYLATVFKRFEPIYVQAKYGPGACFRNRRM